ncbi:MAG: rod shape-determining protein MreC [Lachnospiraceae bacterium]|nr:rod shape-determining protein MreC [Lachnospiraceae bacterium]
MKSKYVLAVLLFLCAALIVTGFFYEDIAEPFRSVYSKVIIPLQKGTNAAGSAIAGWLEDSDTIEELQAENESLRAQVEELEEWNRSVATELDELDRLKGLYDVDYSYEQYDKIAATVIGKTSGNWFSQFTIDKGTADGVETGMNVIADGGLVGIVSDCGEHYAVVRSIIDDESNVSVVVSESNSLCVLAGSLTAYEDGFLELTELSIDVSVSEGAAVITSNISSEFLPGLLVGYVSDLSADKNNLTQSGKVTLAVDFSQLSEVLVITTLKEDYTENLED